MLVINSAKDILFTEAKRGAYNTHSFNKAIKRFLESREFKNLGNPGDIWLMMDNVGFHKSEELRKILNDVGLNVIYSIPYHPQFNLTEYIFNKMKREYYKIENTERYYNLKKEL